MVSPWVFEVGLCEETERGVTTVGQHFGTSVAVMVVSSGSTAACGTRGGSVKRPL